MVVKAAPTAPFVITQAELLFELLVIALDPPSQLGDINQLLEGDVLGQSGEPILGRLGFPVRSLDYQPFFGARLAQPGIAMRRPHALPANREESPSAVPSRHVMVCQASAGRPTASALTELG